MSPGNVWPYTLVLPVLAAAAGAAEGEAVCDRVAAGALGSAGGLAAPTVQPLTTTMTADASSALIKTVGRERRRTGGITRALYPSGTVPHTTLAPPPGGTHHPLRSFTPS